MRRGTVGDRGDLDNYHHAIGTLTLDGELKGYLACVVGHIVFPSRAPWPWFVVVWSDGSKERAFEDYGPEWLTVRELDAGRFEYHGPSRRTEKRFLWWRVVVTEPGRPLTFDFAWLPTEQAQERWKALGLVDADF